MGAVQLGTEKRYRKGERVVGHQCEVVVNKERMMSIGILLPENSCDLRRTLRLPSMISYDTRLEMGECPAVGWLSICDIFLRSREYTPFGLGEV